MAKKRKSDATRLDEVDRSMYTSFCSAANSLSQLYSQATHQQRLSFQAGERHAMEKLYNWILRQQEDGVRVMTGDIFAYVQNELDYGTEEPPPSPRLPFQHQQQSHTAMQTTHSGIPVSSNAFGPAAGGQGQRSVNSDQTKNSVFSNALSSPVRRSLQHYHLSQGGQYANNAMRGNENTVSQTRDPNPPSSNDTSMDMHADSPGHDSPY
ncbi:hypothetical protein Salat_2560300 [Sesamum alatum]|uniref:Holocarboxylase synthetase n=1 Tax=Sesamum alatum TaxID=300844 RepID=A0AAE2CCS8_9LAMI|nr:hypothetical protein Salat_2560300 [Sesamum alatum]